MIPQVSFDDIMNYMDMIEDGTDPDELLEEKRRTLLQTLQEFAQRHIIFQRERQQARDAVVHRVIAMHQEEDPLRAANDHMPAIHDALQGANTGIAKLEDANKMAQEYLQRLQRINSQLTQKLQEAQKGQKNRPPLGRHQEQIYKAVSSLNEHIGGK